MTELSKNMHTLINEDKDLACLKTVFSGQGSAFFVIGKTPKGLQASIRFWKSTSADTSSVCIGLRIRIGDRLGPHLPEKGNNLEFEQFNSFKWTSSSYDGQATLHRSVEGMINIPLPAGMVEESIAVVQDRGFAKRLYQAISEMLPTLELVPQSVFENLMHREVLDCLFKLCGGSLQRFKSASLHVGVRPRTLIDTRVAAPKPLTAQAQLYDDMGL